MAQCPSCKEEVNSSARICPYCHSKLDTFEWYMSASPIMTSLFVLFLAGWFLWEYFEAERYALSNLGKEKVLATIEVYADQYKEPAIKGHIFYDTLPEKILFYKFIEYDYSFSNAEAANVGAYEECAKLLTPLINRALPNTSQPFTTAEFKAVDLSRAPSSLGAPEAYSLRTYAINRRTVSTDLSHVYGRPPGIRAVCRHEIEIPEGLYPLLSRQ